MKDRGGLEGWRRPKGQPTGRPRGGRKGTLAPERNRQQQGRTLSGSLTKWTVRANVPGLFTDCSYECIIISSAIMVSLSRTSYDPSQETNPNRSYHVDPTHEEPGKELYMGWRVWRAQGGVVGKGDPRAGPLQGGR